MPEEQQDEKQYGFLNIAAAMSVTVLIYVGGFVGPVISLISSAHPEVPLDMIRMLTTIPSLMMVLCSLISGQLTRRLPIKKIVYIAMCFQLIGGLMPAFLEGFGVLLASRFIFGVGNGLVFPLASAIVNQLFTGQKRDRLMGIRAAMGALLGSAIALAGGLLGAINWRYAFMGTLVILPIALLIIWKAPENEVPKQAAKEQGKSDSGEKKLTTMSYVIFVGCMLFNMGMISFMTNLSLVVVGNRIGTVTQVGTISSLNTLAAFVAGLVFPYVKKACKRYTTIVPFILVGGALLLLTQAASVPMFMAGALVYGLGFGFYNPQLTILAAQTATKPAYAPVAIAGYSSFVGLGQFLSPIVISFIKRTLGVTHPRAEWLIAGSGIALGIVVVTVYIAVTNLKKKGEAAQDLSRAS
jgi:MFS family permease